jgi:hypothetical protein
MSDRAFAASCLRGDWRLPPGAAVVATEPVLIARPLGGADLAPEIAGPITRPIAETRRHARSMSDLEFKAANAARAWRPPA